MKDEVPTSAKSPFFSFPEGPWHVYLLECADGTLYCGVTKDLRKRLERHNGGLPGSARYTAGRRPVRLLANRVFGCKGDALRFEMQVKSCPRVKKLGLFSRADAWSDAAEQSKSEQTPR
ncbi:MAG: GIY-YIG nuclease family protein [Desulfovibrionaceae bacterium]|nr:GIY-YIG nuclease family protein [Desulfovibrionaceae bacterium]